MKKRATGAAAWPAIAALAIASAFFAPSIDAADSVKITLPTAVSFAVTNVGNSTVGAPNPSAVSFSALNVLATNVLRISVKADADFTPPSGTAIPASKISWTTASATNGTGSNGTLSTSAYTQLFQSTLTKKSGSVNVTWTLGAPGSGIRAGAHTLILRWKLESVIG